MTIVRPRSYEALGIAINDILSTIRPSQIDQEQRQSIVKSFGAFIKSLEWFADAKVEPFGSFVYNIYPRDADLDMSVDIPNLLTTEACALENVWEAFLKRNQPGLKFVPESRVPHLTFETKRWNISCDVTINNHLGQIKSKFLLWISRIDKRFGDIVLLVKKWAKAHDINNPKEGTFNSYALCLLVVFHLQTCVPAIMPPLKEIYGGGINVHSALNSAEELRIQQVSATNIGRFVSSRRTNRSTVAQLMVSFFEKFSDLKAMSAKYVISTYSGKLEDRNNCRYMVQKTYNKVLIEDPLELSDNAARTVRKKNLTRISQVFESTCHSLRAGHLTSAGCKELLLGWRAELM